MGLCERCVSFMSLCLYIYGFVCFVCTGVYDVLVSLSICCVSVYICACGM